MQTLANKHKILNTAEDEESVSDKFKFGAEFGDWFFLKKVNDHQIYHVSISGHLVLFRCLIFV